MFWIVQEDVYARSHKYDLLHILSRLDINFTTVKVFNNTIFSDTEINNNASIITNGSIMLSNIANSKGWKPGSFFNDNFSYKIWSKFYNDFLLNKNAIVTTLKEANPISDIFFARPVLDNKSFNGRLFTNKEFIDFQKKSINKEAGYTDENVEIILSKKRNIGQEHRHYIVGGEVITSSRYKLSGTPNFQEGADKDVLNFVNKILAIWKPAESFVLDTYISDDEVGIVELGSICHAGIYDANLMKIVIAFEDTYN